MTGVREDGAPLAVSTFLSERADLLLPLAARLGPDQPDFTSSVHGSSMAPAIPAGGRIRVHVAEASVYGAGDVVFYLAGDRYTVHRVVHRMRRSGAEDYLITAGDARFAPDPPVPCSRVLGIVVAAECNGDWRPLAPLTSPWHRRLVRALTLPLIILMVQISPAAAGRVATALLTVETRVRLARRRLLRFARSFFAV